MLRQISRCGLFATLLLFILFHPGPTASAAINPDSEKIGIPETIPKKPGDLEDEELLIIKEDPRKEGPIIKHTRLLPRTEDTTTLGKGNAELELDFTITKDGEDRVYSIDNIITVGLLDLLDLSVEYVYLFFDSPSSDSINGFGDTGLFLKYALSVPKKLSFEAAIRGGVVLPTGDEDEGTGSGAKDYELELILEKELKGYDVVLNLTYVLTGDRPDDTPADNLFMAALTIEKEVFEDKGIYIFSEVDYETAESEEESDIITILGGISWDVSDMIGLSFDVGTGLNDAGLDISVTLGLTYSF